MRLTKVSIKPTKEVILKSFKKKRESTYMHDIPIAMLLLTIFEPRKGQKVQKFLIQKVEKTLFTFTVHGLLFTDTVHFLLFMTLFTLKFTYLRGVVP